MPLDPVVGSALDALTFRVTDKDLPLTVRRIDRQKYDIGRIFTKSGVQVLSVLGEEFALSIVDAVHDRARAKGIAV